MAQPVTVISQLQVKVRDACPNPLMLNWLNSLGGFSQWLFQIRQDINIGVDDPRIVERHIITLNVTDPQNKLPVDFRQSWLLFADDLTYNEVQALAQIKYSDAVYAMKSNGDIMKVVADGPATSISNEDGKHSITIQIIFPDNFNPNIWISG